MHALYVVVFAIQILKQCKVLVG